MRGFPLSHWFTVGGSNIAKTDNKTELNAPLLGLNNTACNLPKYISVNRTVFVYKKTP